MSNKSIQKQNWQQTREALARQINNLLFERKLSAADVAEWTGIPLHLVENLTLGREVYHTNILRQLAEFLGKKIKIELVD